MILRNVRYMINTVKMRLRKEWVVAAVAMTHLISFPLSLVVVDFQVWILVGKFGTYSTKYYMYDFCV